MVVGRHTEACQADEYYCICTGTVTNDGVCNIATSAPTTTSTPTPTSGTTPSPTATPSPTSGNSTPTPTTTTTTGEKKTCYHYGCDVYTYTWYLYNTIETTEDLCGPGDSWSKFVWNDATPPENPCPSGTSKPTSTPQPTSGNSTPTPTATPKPTSGNTTPTPTSGNQTSTPSPTGTKTPTPTSSGKTCDGYANGDVVKEARCSNGNWVCNDGDLSKCVGGDKLCYNNGVETDIYKCVNGNWQRLSAATSTPGSSDATATPKPTSGGSTSDGSTSDGSTSGGSTSGGSTSDGSTPDGSTPDELGTCDVYLCNISSGYIWKYNSSYQSITKEQCDLNNGKYTRGIWNDSTHSLEGTSCSDASKSTCYVCTVGSSSQYVWANSSTNAANAATKLNGVTANNCTTTEESNCYGTTVTNCYECNGSKKYVMADSETEAMNNSGSTSCTIVATNKCNTGSNPKTGTFGIIVAWIIGIMTIGYAMWYFKKNSSLN